MVQLLSTLIKYNKKDFLKLYLNLKGLDLNFKDSYGNTCLFYAGKLYLLNFFSY